MGVLAVGPKDKLPKGKIQLSRRKLMTSFKEASSPIKSYLKLIFIVSPHCIKFCSVSVLFLQPLKQKLTSSLIKDRKVIRFKF